jgi:Caspase domain
MVKRALLVGLDIYPDPRNNLNSCVADTKAFRTLLMDTYGFDSSDIKLLHNQDATLANVRSGLDTLFAGASAGDQIVYFESSHGYRYPEGDTMVEVLCLYDGFLKDTEFVQRTQGLPPDVLTVVLDACHSGGMNKLFFPGGDVQVARVKVWQPSPEQADRDAALASQVTSFRFFGRHTASDGGAVAKNLVINPTGVVPSKDIDAGSGNLNGALFAACLSDQTAAAGSPPTENYSAFTYGVIKEAQPGIALNDLCQRVVARLESLNMSQTPTAIAPPTHPEMLTDAFITMQGAPQTMSFWTPTAAEQIEAQMHDFDYQSWLRQQLSPLR